MGLFDTLLHLHNVELRSTTLQLIVGGCRKIMDCRSFWSTYLHIPISPWSVLALSPLGLWSHHREITPSSRLLLDDDCRHQIQSNISACFFSAIRYSGSELTLGPDWRCHVRSGLHHAGPRSIWFSQTQSILHLTCSSGYTQIPPFACHMQYDS